MTNENVARLPVVADEAVKYARLTKEKCGGFIAQKTRFDAYTLNFPDARAFPVRLTICVDYQVSAGHSVDTYKGSHRGSTEDVHVHSSADFHDQVANLKHEALTAPGLLQNVTNEMAAAGYAGKKKDYQHLIHNRRAFLTYQCGNCGGSGRVSCGGCHGSGTVAHSTCGGTGSVLRSYTITVNVNGQTQSRTELRSESCTCGNGRVSCGTCGGSGRVQCNRCAGTGVLTDVGTVGVHVTPTYRWQGVDPSHPRVISCLDTHFDATTAGQICTLTNEAWQATDVLAGTGTFSFDTMACELDIVLEDTLFKPFAFGNAGEIYDFDGAVEKLLAEDLESLEESVGLAAPTEGPDALQVPRRDAVKQFCQSELNCDVIDTLNRYRQGDAAVAALRGAVTASYVSRADAALKLATKRIGRATRVPYWSAAFIVLGAIVWWGTQSVLSEYSSSGEAWFVIGGLSLVWYIATLGVVSLASHADFKGLGGVRLSEFSRGRNGLAWLPLPTVQSLPMLGASFAIAAATIAFPYVAPRLPFVGHYFQREAPAELPPALAPVELAPAPPAEAPTEAATETLPSTETPVEAPADSPVPLAPDAYPPTGEAGTEEGAPSIDDQPMQGQAATPAN